MYVYVHGSADKHVLDSSDPSKAGIIDGYEPPDVGASWFPIAVINPMTKSFIEGRVCFGPTVLEGYSP